MDCIARTRNSNFATATSVVNHGPASSDPPNHDIACNKNLPDKRRFVEASKESLVVVIAWTPARRDRSSCKAKAYLA